MEVGVVAESGVWDIVIRACEAEIEVDEGAEAGLGAVQVAVGIDSAGVGVAGPEFEFVAAGAAVVAVVAVAAVAANAVVAVTVAVVAAVGIVVDGGVAEGLAGDGECG